MSVYVRDGYTFQLFLRTMVKHCKNYKSNTFITYIYVRNNVLDKYENNFLHVNTKPWYETDDKVVLKETKKKYGDIYLNKLFKVSINHLNKSPVILIHIIWFLEEVCKKKSVTLRTLVYDFLKVRKNQQMSPHRVGLFFIATINILSLWNHYVCVHGGIHHSRFFVAKNRIPRRFKATKMSCKKHITD